MLLWIGMISWLSQERSLGGQDEIQDPGRMDIEQTAGLGKIMKAVTDITANETGF